MNVEVGSRNCHSNREIEGELTKPQSLADEDDDERGTSHTRTREEDAGSDYITEPGD